VQKAARLTRHLIRSSLSANNIKFKDEYNPVTVGDFAAQALLTHAIHTVFPDDVFVGEESATELRRNSGLLHRVWNLLCSGDEGCERFKLSRNEICDLIDLGGKGDGRSAGRRLWVFDPIDGTATYMRGGQYAVNLALVEDGVQKLSVIGCPNLPYPFPLDEMPVSDLTTDEGGLGCMVHAVKGQGAFVRPISMPLTVVGGGEMEGVEYDMLAPATKLSMHAAAHVKIDDIRFTDCTTTTSTIIDLHKKVAERLSISQCWPGPDLYSSVMKYALLGLGMANCNIRIFKFRYYKSNIWDHAGGLLLFEEVGGKTTDLDGKELDLSNGRKMSDNYGFVAAPKNLHTEVLKTVQEVMREAGLAVELTKR
jgi:3'(2'), 5'-bisphosphate nucleotidase